MKTMKINKLAAVFGSLVITFGLTLGSALSAQAVSSVTLNTTNSTIVLTTIGSTDQKAIDTVAASKQNYQVALDAYKVASSNGQAVKQAYKKAVQAWQKMNNSQKKAKQQIGKTFKASVALAKATFRQAMAASNAGSSKAEAKAARDAAIASASVARNEALASITFTIAKPDKPGKK